MIAHRSRLKRKHPCDLSDEIKRVRITVTPGELRLKNDLAQCRKLMRSADADAMAASEDEESIVLQIELEAGVRGPWVTIRQGENPLEVQLELMKHVFAFQVAKQYPHVVSPVRPPAACLPGEGASGARSAPRCAGLVANDRALLLRSAARSSPANLAPLLGRHRWCTCCPRPTDPHLSQQRTPGYGCTR